MCSKKIEPIVEKKCQFLILRKNRVWWEWTYNYSMLAKERTEFTWLKEWKLLLCVYPIKMQLHREGRSYGEEHWVTLNLQQPLEEVNSLCVKLNQRSGICTLFWTAGINIRKKNSCKVESGYLWKTGLRRETRFFVMF